MIANNKNFPLFNLQDTFLARKRSSSSNFITQPIESSPNSKKSKLTILFIESLINKKGNKIEENPYQIQNNLKLIKNKSFDGPTILNKDTDLSNYDERSKNCIKPMEISKMNKIAEFSMQSLKLSNIDHEKLFLSPRIAKSKDFSSSESKKASKINKVDFKQEKSAKIRAFDLSTGVENERTIQDFKKMEVIPATNEENRISKDNISQFNENLENNLSRSLKKSNSLAISKSKTGKVINYFEEKSKYFQTYLLNLNPTPIFNFKRSKHNKDKDFSNLDEDDPLVMKNDKGSKVFKNNGISILGGNQSLIEKTLGIAGKINDLAEKEHVKLREVGFENKPAINLGTKNEMFPSISSIKKSVFKRNIQNRQIVIPNYNSLISMINVFHKNLNHLLQTISNAQKSVLILKRLSYPHTYLCRIFLEPPKFNGFYANLNPKLMEENCIMRENDFINAIINPADLMKEKLLNENILTHLQILNEKIEEHILECTIHDLKILEEKLITEVNGHMQIGGPDLNLMDFPKEGVAAELSVIENGSGKLVGVSRRNKCLVEKLDEMLANVKRKTMGKGKAKI